MYLSIVCLSCEHLIAGILHSSKICKLFKGNLSSSCSERLLLQKTLFGVVYIPPDNSIYSNIDMFNDIENTLLDNDLQACLIGDFNAHTGNVSQKTQ
jgi:hypothetical protein